MPRGPSLRWFFILSRWPLTLSPCLIYISTILNFIGVSECASVYKSLLTVRARCLARLKHLTLHMTLSCATDGRPTPSRSWKNILWCSEDEISGDAFLAAQVSHVYAHLMSFPSAVCNIALIWRISLKQMLTASVLASKLSGTPIHRL